MSGYKWNNTNSTPKNTTKTNSNKPNLCRVVVDENIKKTILLDELSMPIDKSNDGGFANTQYNTINKAGIDAPVICINDKFLEKNEITYLEIDCTSFIPTIILTIKPNNVSFLTSNAIKDGDIISLFIRSTSDIITPIRCDFIINRNRINGYEINNPNSNVYITLNGELFIPGIHSSKDNIHTCGTSKEAIKDICKKLGIGFAFNDADNTIDKQLWFSPKKKIVDYIKDVTEHSWKDEESFFKSWIDLYYNLNFINVNKSLISEEDIDITAGTVSRTMQSEAPLDTSEKNTTTQIKLLSNGEMNKNTPFFIYDITPVNNSSNITNYTGAKIKNSMFIHNQNFYNKGESPYISLDNVQMYDPKKTDNFMILRGRNKYNKNTANESDMEHVNLNIEDINTQNVWRGIQYTISDVDKDTESNKWSGNVNLNYNRAFTHNKINNMELEKLYVKVMVAGPCLQVMRGEKIPIIVYYKDDLSMNTINSEDEKLLNINKLYSGYYFVDGYKLYYTENNAKDSMLSNFKTEFILKRREWPVPVDYQKE